MIGWEDIYKVVVAVTPLYFALMLGYCSVKWWKIFEREQCNAVNQLVCYFTLPLFAFEFVANVDPFHMNYMFIAGDVISKVVIVAVLALWAKCSSKGSYCWSITSFSLTTLTNSLVVGVPIIKAMYGQLGVDLVVQASVIQAIIWLTLLLFVLEIRRSQTDYTADHKTILADSRVASVELGKVLEVNGVHHGGDVVAVSDARPTFWCLMKIVGLKLATNPNSYACIVGLVWAFFSKRWNFELPPIIEGSVLIMSKAGTGTAMFSMGMFMGSQEKIIACGMSLAAFGMVLKFIAGPAAMAIGAIAVGLHGDVLRVAIIQAALPQSITSFIFAKEYGLHADVLSTAVIFGMIVSLPMLIAYYAILEFLH